MRVAVNLILDGLHDLGAAVAGVEDGNATGEVNIALAFDVPHFRVEATRDKDFMALAHTPGNGGAPAGHQGGVGLFGLVLHITPARLVVAKVMGL